MSLNLPSKASAGPQCAMLGLVHTALDLLHCNNVGRWAWFTVFTAVVSLVRCFQKSLMLCSVSLH